MNNIERRFIDHYAKVRARCYGDTPIVRRPLSNPALVWVSPPPPEPPPPEGWHDIVREVASKHRIGRSDIMGIQRLHKMARWEAWCRIRAEYIMPGLNRRPSYREIALMFKRCDHSTVKKGIDRWLALRDGS